MSQRKHGNIVVSIPGERSHPVRLNVDWTTRAEKHRRVEAAVEMWARNIRKWWGVFVDLTTLDGDGGGKVFINGDHSKSVASFRVEALARDGA